MARRLAIAAVAALILAAGAAGYYWWTSPNRHTTASRFTGLEWQYQDGILQSATRRELQMAFDPSLEYLGGQAFELYGAAAVEQHLFGRSWPDGRTRSVLLVQFESVLPGIDWAYDYSDAEFRTQISGLPFFTDASPGRTHWLFPKGEPGTDGYRAAALAADAGYDTPEDFVWLRSVHIPDPDAQSEILIIMRDDLSEHDLTRDALVPGGAEADRWPGIVADRIAELEGLVSFTALSSSEPVIEADDTLQRPPSNMAP